MKTILLTQTFLVILLNPVHGQLVYRDPSFGTGGVDTITYMSSNMDEAPWDIALLPNGRILVLGYSDDGENEEYPWIARLKANGDLDKSFGTSGVKVIDTEGYYHDLRDIAIQPDGKILINGSLNRGFAIYRMDSLGVMDQSFGTGGLTNINFCSMDAAQEIAVSKSGKIAAVGYSCEFNSEFIIALFNPDGSLDLNFNGTGYFTSAFNKAFRVFQAVKFQSDRKIVAAGDCIASDVSMRTKIYVVRIDTTGHLDEGFGTSGEFGYTTSWDTDLYDMAIQKDGKILLCFNKILRLNPNGTIDTSFGNNGIVETKVADYDIKIRCMKLQEDDKIVVAGITDQFETYQWDENIFIARYDKNGILDNSFGDNGIITTQIGKGEFDVYTYAMVLQPDNKILIAADCWNNVLDRSKVLVARFLPDESVGIHKMEPAKSGIIAFPNPVDDYIILENIYNVSDRLSWQLFDLTGRKMSNGMVDSDPCTIYTGNLKPSIYLLQVTDNEYKSVKNLRIIKK